MVASGRSLWADTVPGNEIATGVPLPGDLQTDVAIVGAGYTGLWTAWYLKQLDPSIRVAVLERETIGHGASGRNGGWCSAILPMSHGAMERRHGRDAAQRMQRAMERTVSEVVGFTETHGPAGIAHRGGTVDLARNRPQLTRLRDGYEAARRSGFGDDLVWLDAAAARAACGATGTLAATWTPHCAAVHPLRLVHAVARAALAAGVAVHEHTAVTAIGDRSVTTDRGVVDADVVVRATEGFTSGLPGHRRTLLPIYSLMVATEPLPDEAWEEIGLADRPTFHDLRHLIVYGQRTADGRLAFGGRGAPYHFRSRVRPEFDTDDRIRELLTDTLHEMFPALRGRSVTHHWGGPLGVARDWSCAVRYDPTTGHATAGGYVGDGVATSNLAGRTLASLITGRPPDDDIDDVTTLPWVGHASRRWEPEPLRWVGVNSARWAARRADTTERRTGRPSRVWGGLIERLLRR